MKHRSDYRIIKIHKKGYYTYYRIEEKFLSMFWLDCSRAFDSVAQAEGWIADRLVVQTREVVQ